MAESADVTLIDCEFDDNGGAGVSVTPGTVVKAQGVKARRNTGAGFEVRSREDVSHTAQNLVEGAELPPTLKAAIRLLIEELAEAQSEPARRSKYNEIVGSLANHATVLALLEPIIANLV